MKRAPKSSLSIKITAFASVISSLAAAGLFLATSAGVYQTGLFTILLELADLQKTALQERNEALIVDNKAFQERNKTLIVKIDGQKMTLTSLKKKISAKDKEISAKDKEISAKNNWRNKYIRNDIQMEIIKKIIEKTNKSYKSSLTECDEAIYLEKLSPWIAWVRKKEKTRMEQERTRIEKAKDNSPLSPAALYILSLLTVVEYFKESELTREFPKSIKEDLPPSFSECLKKSYGECNLAEVADSYYEVRKKTFFADKVPTGANVITNIGKKAIQHTFLKKKETEDLKKFLANYVRNKKNIYGAKTNPRLATGSDFKTLKSHAEGIKKKVMVMEGDVENLKLALNGFFKKNYPVAEQ